METKGKGTFCYLVSESLTTLFPVVTWKAENVDNLAKESCSRQSVEGAACFLAAHEKCDVR